MEGRIPAVRLCVCVCVFSYVFLYVIAASVETVMCIVVVGKPEEIRPRGRCTRRWQNNTEVHRKGTGWKTVNCIVR